MERIGEEGADSPEFVKIAGPASEGFVIVTHLSCDDPRPVVQAFLKECEAQFKINPDMVGTSVYGAFMFIYKSTKRAKSLEWMWIEARGGRKVL